MIDGKRCYSPYAICRSNLPAPASGCYEHYKLSEMSDEELLALARVHKKPIPRGVSKDNILTSKQRTELLREIRSVLG